MDIDLEYIDVEEDKAEDMSESAREAFRAAVKEHGTDGVPLIHLKTECGEICHRGYSGLESLCDIMEKIKCRRPDDG